MSILLFIVAIVLAAALVLWMGARLSLDTARAHTAAAAALPERTADAGPSNGLVRLRAADLEFRSRVKNLDGDGEPVILVHGFPQSSASYEPLIDAVAASGYRAVAYDQRGYSPGARPDGVDAYGVGELMRDVLRIADRLGFERFHLVGHDWGAAAAWPVAMSAPERLLSFTALSIGHSFAFRDALKSDADQRRRSLYIALLRLPVFPELLLAWNRFFLLRRVMYDAMPDAQVREYRALLAEPGALTAVLNFYRALGRPAGLTMTPEVDVPTLFIWGNRDPASGRTAAEGTAAYMRGPYRFEELDAGHWLLETRSEQVIALILEHLRANHDQPKLS